MTRKKQTDFLKIAIPLLPREKEMVLRFFESRALKMGHYTRALLFAVMDPDKRGQIEAIVYEGRGF